MGELYLVRSAFQDAFRPRRLISNALLLLLPALLAFLWRLLAPKETFSAEGVYDTLVVALVLGFSLTILSVTGGTGVVSQELEQRTIVYLLTRPIARWRILLAKWFVSLVLVAGVTVLSLILLAAVLFGINHLGKADIGPDIRALLFGTLAYGAIFLLLGALLSKPLTYGLLFVFGWESWASNLPGAFGRVSIMTYLRVLAARDIDPATAAAPDANNPFTALAASPNLEITTPQAVWTLLGITAIALIAAIVVFSKREYTPREDAG